MVIIDGVKNETHFMQTKQELISELHKIQNQLNLMLMETHEFKDKTEIALSMTEHFLDLCKVTRFSDDYKDVFDKTRSWLDEVNKEYMDYLKLMQKLEKDIRGHGTEKL